MTEQGTSVASPVGNAKGPALTWSERAGPNSGAIRNAAPLGCLNARDERMVDALTKPATSQPGPQRNPPVHRQDVCSGVIFIHPPSAMATRSDEAPTDRAPAVRPPRLEPFPSRVGKPGQGGWRQ